MIKLRNKAISVILALTYLITNQSCTSDENSRFLQINDNLNKFTLNITLSTENHELSIKQNLIYHNMSGTDLSEIYFNLYPNGYKKEGGGITVNSFAIDGSQITLEKEDDTLFKVDLHKPLISGDTVSIDMDYTVKIPNISDHFGYQGNHYNLGNFCISPAVYGENGWCKYEYYTLGDFNYNDIANFDVTINVPEGYVVAASGKEIEKHRFQSNNVRDFVFCTNDKFQSMSEMSDGISITVYYVENLESDAFVAIEAAKESIALYSDLLTFYPYPTFGIVLTNLESGVGAIEYPCFTLVNIHTPLDELEQMFKDLSNEQNNNFRANNNRMYDYQKSVIKTMVAHEVAHQWFYGLIGNDQIMEPWLDESLASFFENVYLERYSPDLQSLINREKHSTNDKDWVYKAKKHKDYNSKDPSMFTYYMKIPASVYDFKKYPESYSEVVYSRGDHMLYLMRKEMGEEDFYKVFKSYTETFLLKNVTTRDFVAFWKAHSPIDLDEIFINFIGKDYL